MLEAVRRYATKIVLIHVLLFVLVVGTVLFAARQVYSSAREQAMKQSEQRLGLLADQTARGIENHYLSIMSDLELILRDETDPALTQPRALQGPLSGRFSMRRFSETRTVPVTPALTAIMWRQLRGRVSQLFLVDNETGRVLASFPETKDGNAREITQENLEWFKGLKEPSISRFRRAEGADGFHIIAVPAVAIGGGPGGGGAGGPGAREPRDPPGREPREPGGGRDVIGARTVVAIVPIDSVKERFFDPLNGKGVVGAALLDDSGTVLVSIDPKLAGTKLLEQLEPWVRAKMEPFVIGGDGGSLVIEGVSKIAGREMPPRIMAFEPIRGVPSRRWTVLTTSLLSESDALVTHVFKGALLWAVFLTASITGLLMSTAFFMIRGRVRLERTRHELLRRELEQARQIQLAWLPAEGSAPAGLEVFAANLPASHISGDFYNWFALPTPDGDTTSSQKIAVVIGDVTGHGMAAAFLMATAQLLVRMTLLRHGDPGRCLREVNRQLCSQGFRGQFVTMVVMVLDVAANTLEVATAGHPAPLVQRAEGFQPLMIEPQLVLGVDPDEAYVSQAFVLQPRSSVMLYTDGVVEADSAMGVQYGVDRLIKALHGDGGPATKVEAVLADVKRYCGGRELHDDVTLVAVRVSS
jgi:serine phosphatase RsbU (regulator of sigma subunit)